MPRTAETLDEELPGSSAGETTDLSDAASQPEKAEGAAAESSPAKTENDEDGSLNIVRDVVDEREDGKSKSAASSAEDGEVKEAGEGSASTRERDDEGYSDVPFHKHPRFVELINERNGFREDATRYRNVQSFLDQHAMTGEEAANVLSSVAKAKYDPVEAWQEIRPWVQKLLIAAGEVLPDDLMAQIKEGKLSEDAAFQISRERARGNSARARLSFDEQRRQRQTEDDLGKSLWNAANEWEGDRRAKDPNFDAKFGLIQREVAFLQMQEGRPRDVAGVKDQLKRAYDAVNKTFGATGNRNNPTPARRPAKTPVVGGQVSGNVRTPEPQSTLDIIRANRRRVSA